MKRYWLRLALILLAVFVGACLAQDTAHKFSPQEGDYVVSDFHFQSGESLPKLRLHYTTLGQPKRDSAGRVTNAVLILHGTGGTGHQFLQPQFADVLFGPGQLLDVSRYYIILPDNIGHGKSSKPSDGLHAKFPHYDYDDMVKAQHELVEKGLGINHLRLIMGTSMGCMHSWVWGESYPDYMDAMMPMACLPVPIAGRNRMWRKMLIDGIQQDPEWKGGEYTSQPRAGIQTATDLLIIAGTAAIPLQKTYPTRDSADRYLGEVTNRYSTLDANDILYAVSSSRNYDPSAQLGKITVPVMFVNSADDFINPPEMGIAQEKIKEVKRGQFVLIPASDQTHGHGSHTWAALWQQYLERLLEESKP